MSSTCDRPFSSRRTATRMVGGVAHVAAVVVMLSGCAAGATTRAGVPEDPRGARNLTCRYVGLEDVSSPSDQNADSVSLLATYRFREPDAAPPKAPLSLKFQVDRSRVTELTQYLASKPEVICQPEADSNYAAHVEPFGDIRGEPQR
jgi:hypothetical protein